MNIFCDVCNCLLWLFAPLWWILQHCEAWAFFAVLYLLACRRFAMCMPVIGSHIVSGWSPAGSADGRK